MTKPASTATDSQRAHRKADATARRRLVAMYLPQFHPIPENNQWWGQGFTEWTNVTKARPLFPGHYQPHLPSDMGFYDLRVPETRDAQADLARQYGIDAFCYYHYWFNGTRLLETPLNGVLATGKPDFPFCLCWANENWTRVWDGGERHILMAQHYGPDDDRAHIRALLPVFDDRRYLRIGGRPVFIVYSSRHLPDATATTGIWREEAVKAGIGDLYLIKVDRTHADTGTPRDRGFDAAMDFQPSGLTLPPPRHRDVVSRWASRLGLLSRAFREHQVFDYQQFASHMLAQPQPPYLRFPCVTPMWDNTARRKTQGAILSDSHPDIYERWLADTLRTFHPPSPEENLVFVNAWNEWAEGNHLEPDQRWGRAYLEATLRAKHSF